MKKIAIVALTKKGFILGNKIYHQYPQVCDRYTLARQKKEGWTVSFNSLPSLIGNIFNRYKGIILIMSTGIAVRILAPFLQDKSCDPAVVVMDENNNYAISLLSGHLGGANSLAHELGKLTGCQPVITTATDTNHLHAIDVISQEWQLKIEPVKHIKYFNKALLEGNNYTYWVENGICLPETVKKIKNIVSFKKNLPGFHVLVTCKNYQEITSRCLYLRPQNLVLGIGCRKDYPQEELKRIVEKFFVENQISIKSLSTIATIDFKAKEQAIVSLANKLKIPLKIFTKEQLMDCMKKNDNLSRSTFVEKQVGVWGVCEPAAILAANNNNLLVKKTKINGITLAVVRKEPYRILPRKVSWFNGGEAL